MGLTYYPDTSKEWLHQNYLECLDITVICIQDRFNQPGCEILNNLEDLLLKKRSPGMKITTWSCNLSWTSIKMTSNHPAYACMQLELCTTTFSSLKQRPTPIDVRDYFSFPTHAQRGCMSEVCTLLKLWVVMPAKNAVSERSASGFH